MMTPRNFLRSLFVCSSLLALAACGADGPNSTGSGQSSAATQQSEDVGAGAAELDQEGYASISATLEGNGSSAAHFGNLILVESDSQIAAFDDKALTPKWSFEITPKTVGVVEAKSTSFSGSLMVSQTDDFVAFGVYVETPDTLDAAAEGALYVCRLGTDGKLKENCRTMPSEGTELQPDGVYLKKQEGLLAEKVDRFDYETGEVVSSAHLSHPVQAIFQNGVVWSSLVGGPNHDIYTDGLVTDIKSGKSLDYETALAKTGGNVGPQSILPKGTTSEGDVLFDHAVAAKGWTGASEYRDSAIWIGVEQVSLGTKEIVRSYDWLRVQESLPDLKMFVAEYDGADEGEDLDSIVAHDTATGELLWDSKDSLADPDAEFIAATDGDEGIVILYSPIRDLTVGFGARDGERMWEIPGKSEVDNPPVILGPWLVWDKVGLVEWADFEA